MKFTRIITVLALVVMVFASVGNVTAHAAVIAPPEFADDMRVIDEPAQPEIVKFTFDEVPLYDQRDFPHIPYSQGSIATSGCGITCMAMVASYILDEPISPATLGLEYNKTASDNVTRMLNAATGLGIEYEKVGNYHEMVKALEEGKVAIALMTADSIFTNYGHFIVITGINEDGTFMVNDPWGGNYDSYPNEFANGFASWQILKGYSGAWVFDKNAE